VPDQCRVAPHLWTRRGWTCPPRRARPPRRAKLTLKSKGKTTTITRALRRNAHGGQVTDPVSYWLPRASDAKAKILRKLKKATTFKLVVVWYTDHLEETTLTKNLKLGKGL
jgi:hypothetical protein